MNRWFADGENVSVSVWRSGDSSVRSLPFYRPHQRSGEFFFFSPPVWDWFMALPPSGFIIEGELITTRSRCSVSVLSLWFNVGGFSTSATFNSLLLLLFLFLPSRLATVRGLHQKKLRLDASCLIVACFCMKIVNISPPNSREITARSFCKRPNTQVVKLKTEVSQCKSGKIKVKYWMKKILTQWDNKHKYE